MATKYMNPYLAGFLLGIVLFISFFIAGNGLGTTGANNFSIITFLQKFFTNHLESSDFFMQYIKPGICTMKRWIVFEVFGILIGAFLSAIIANRIQLGKTDQSKKISKKTRLALALLGGILFGYGARLSRGCASGAALSGMAVLSLSGFFSMIVLFGTAGLLSYFFKKLWL